MPTDPRPARTYSTGAVTRTLRIAALAGVAATAAWSVARYPSMPDIVPTHFGPGGEPDDWGSTTSVLWLAGVMVAIAVLVAWLSTKPRWANYPVRVTERNAQHLYREGERTLVWLLVALAVVFVGLAQLVVGGASMLAIALGLVGMLAVPLVGAVRLLRAPGGGAP